MSKAGQADAIGGVFRVVTATYLAVHALREQPVAGLELPPHVHTVHLDFETDDPTDDLVATMSDGGRSYISAKRQVGNDRHLRDTVMGWVGQMDDARDGDLLVLAAETLKGVVKDLADALRRRRDGRAPAGRHRDAVAAVTSHVPAALVDDLLRRVRVLHIPSATGASQTRALLESMAGYLVEDGNGGAVVSVLSDSFLTQSGSASASSTEDWVQEIRRGARPVIADGGGPAGMRLAAKLAAREAYNEVLTACRGRIDLTLLAEDLPPVTVQGLLEGVRVRIEKDKREGDRQLIRVIRRWRRMLLVGQPGSGKSVALRELAAECAEDPHAPLPIQVHLPELLSSKPEGLTADALIAAAAEHIADLELRAALVRTMRQELDDGTAILLCDGLDECGSRTSWIAQQIKEVIDALNPRVGVIVATRANAAAAAARLGLPRADLITPTDLGDTVDSILIACAEVRVDDVERETWLAPRRRWISDAREQHPQLLNAPLLAVLLALVCADTPEADLPKGRALLLHAAIQQSVERWETQRASAPPERWAPELTQDMLLDGYVSLGRLLDSGATPTKQEVLEKLSTMFRDPDGWAMAPSPAREIAADVLRFWDERVAVFVLNASNRLSGRSKVFIEIATAIWTLTATDDEIAAWLSDVVPYTDSDGALALATGLNERVVEHLLSLSGTTVPSASIFLLELADRDIVDLNDDQMTRLLTQIRRAVERSVTGDAMAQRTPREPHRLWFMVLDRHDETYPAWHLVELACSLKLQPSHRRLREEIVAAAELEAGDAATAVALRVLSDAEHEGRSLDPRELGAVTSVIDQPLPPDGELVRQSRRRSAIVGGAPLGRGVARVALKAVRHLDALPKTTARWAFEASMKTSHGFSDKIRTALAAAHVDMNEWWDARSPLRHMPWGEDHNRYETQLLEDITSLESSDVNSAGEPHEIDLWSLTSIGDLLEATGYGTVSIPDFAWAFEHDSEATRRGWLSALADAYGVDKNQAARQAAWMLRVRSETTNEAWHVDPNWFVITMSSPSGRHLTDNSAIVSPEQQEALLTSLEAFSDWLAWSAAEVLVNDTALAWDPAALFDKDMSPWPMDRAALVYAVAISGTVGDKRAELFARAAESPVGEYRMAAGYSLALHPELDQDGAVEMRLQQDPDLTVRPNANRKDEPTASYWTCRLCRTRNDPEIEDCPGCDHGSRPG